MSCCFGGVRKKKKSQKPLSEINGKKEVIAEEPNEKYASKNNQTKQQVLLLKKSNSKKSANQEPKELPMNKQRDSKIGEPSPRTVKPHKQNVQQNPARKSQIKNSKQFLQDQLILNNQQKVEVQLKKQQDPRPKQQNQKNQSLIVQSQKVDEIKIEIKEIKAEEQKHQSKTLQLRFYDEGSIVGSHRISTFRYDTLLAHYFAEEDKQEQFAQI